MERSGWLWIVLPSMAMVALFGFVAYMAVIVPLRQGSDDYWTFVINMTPISVFTILYAVIAVSSVREHISRKLV